MAKDLKIGVIAEPPSALVRDLALKYNSDLAYAIKKNSDLIGSALIHSEMVGIILSGLAFGGIRYGEDLTGNKDAFIRFVEIAMRESKR
jgi:hypothetical protein